MIAINGTMNIIAINGTPIQCNTWGHSDTSGIDTIDYFISSSYFETQQSLDYYSEKLLKLDCLSMYYEQPLKLFQDS